MEDGMEWVMVGMELGVAFVIAVAIYITMKKWVHHAEKNLGQNQPALTPQNQVLLY